jgi:DNA (cytosine-5)-methyltransferase 1
MLRIASLFSGAGGLDWGFKMVGTYDIVFANDVLYAATLTYSRNFRMRLVECGEDVVEAVPRAVMACDVEKIIFSPLADKVDILIGGPPCQDFSIIRGPPWDRNGIKVKRGKLYAHFVRALAVLQPKAFVFENVPGLLSANDGYAFRTIIEDLAKLNIRWKDIKKMLSLEVNGRVVNSGYEIIYSGVSDFSALGVPQRRKRLIIVGIRRDLFSSPQQIREAKTLLERAISGDGSLFKKYPLTPLEVFEGRTLTQLQDIYVEIMEKWKGIWREVGTERAKRWKREVWDKLTLDVVEDYLRLNGIERADEAEFEEAMKLHEKTLKQLGYYGVPVAELRLPDGTTDLPKNGRNTVERVRRIPPGENHEFVYGTRWEVEGKGISLVYRRLHPLQPAYTVVAYGGGGTYGYHYDRDRAALTLREKARLQTFPDSFLFYGSKAQIRAQIGEAVPPLAAAEIAKALLRILEKLEPLSPIPKA